MAKPEKTNEQPARDAGKQPRGEAAKIPQPWGGKNVSGGRTVGQDRSAEHDGHMRHAAQHSTYTGGDHKSDAPAPFGPGDVDVDEPTRGQETMPKPFNTGKSRDAGKGKNPPYLGK